MMPFGTERATLASIPMEGFSVRLCVCFAFAGVLLLSGCDNFFTSENNSSSSSSGGTSSINNYLYIAETGSSGAGTITGYANNSGALTETSDTPLTLSYIPTVLKVVPGNLWLYAGSNTSTGGIYAFSIDASDSGVLTHTNNGSAVAADAPVAMDVDSTGNYLVVLDNDYTTVNSYSINSSTGALTLVSEIGATSGSTAGAVRFLPNNNYVYVSTGTGGLTIYSFSKGVLTTVGTLAASSSISFNDLCADSTSSYLLIARSGANAGVDVHAIASSGQLGTGTIYSAGSGPVSLACDSSLSTVYSADKSSATIYEFTLSSGVLTQLATINSGTTPSQLAIDKSGAYLFSLNIGGSPDLEDYTIGTSGALTAYQYITSTATTPVAMAMTH